MSLCEVVNPEERPGVSPEALALKCLAKKALGLGQEKCARLLVQASPGWIPQSPRASLVSWGTSSCGDLCTVLLAGG